MTRRGVCRSYIFSVIPRNSRGQDTFNYKENYCYEYDQLLFDGMTPQEFLDCQPMSWPTKDDTTKEPSIGTCGEWCWKVSNVESKNSSCTDICLTKDKRLCSSYTSCNGVLAIKVFVTGHGNKYTKKSFNFGSQLRMVKPRIFTAFLCP